MKAMGLELSLIFIALGIFRNPLWLNEFPKSLFCRSKQPVLHCETARFAMPNGSFCSGIASPWVCGIPFCKYSSKCQQAAFRPHRAMWTGMAIIKKATDNIL